MRIVRPVWASLRSRVLLISIAALAALVGCQNMQVQPKLAEPYDSSPLFGRASREILPEAVAVGHLNDDTHLYEGLVDGELATTFPYPVTRDMLERGQQQYEQFCTACHGYSGYGDGVVVLEGYPRVAQSYHAEDFRDAPVGRIYRAITYGYGIMYSYAARVGVEDRWAIVAYIRALQYSQNAPIDALPAEMQAQVSAPGA